MARQAKWTKQGIVDEAISFVDQHGVEALTLRSLSVSLGMTHPALYRYYETKNALLSDMVDELFRRILDLGPIVEPSPEQRLHHLGSRVRMMMRSHPNMILALITSSGDMPHAQEITEQTITLLRELGLTGDSLPLWHRALETYVMGSIAYDFAGAPHHLDFRGKRLRIYGSEFESLANNNEDIQQINEEAFDQGLKLLINAAKRQAHESAAATLG